MENFNPTIKCPHCGGVNKPSISGWGREGLNNRQHTCKHCDKDYVVVVYVETSKDLEISEGHNSVPNRIPCSRIAKCGAAL